MDRFQVPGDQFLLADFVLCLHSDGTYCVRVGRDGSTNPVDLVVLLGPLLFGPEAGDGLELAREKMDAGFSVLVWPSPAEEEEHGKDDVHSDAPAGGAAG